MVEFTREGNLERFGGTESYVEANIMSLTIDGEENYVYRLAFVGVNEVADTKDATAYLRGQFDRYGGGGFLLLDFEGLVGSKVGASALNILGDLRYIVGNCSFIVIKEPTKRSISTNLAISVGKMVLAVSKPTLTLPNNATDEDIVSSIAARINPTVHKK